MIRHTYWIKRVLVSCSTGCGCVGAAKSTEQFPRLVNEIESLASQNEWYKSRADLTIYRVTALRTYSRSSVGLCCDSFCGWFTSICCSTYSINSQRDKEMNKHVASFDENKMYACGCMCVKYTLVCHWNVNAVRLFFYRGSYFVMYSHKLTVPIWNLASILKW